MQNEDEQAMKPEEIEALVERIARHNRWLKGELRAFPHHDEYFSTQYRLDLDIAVELLRGLARDRSVGQVPEV